MRKRFILGVSALTIELALAFGVAAGIGVGLAQWGADGGLRVILASTIAGGVIGNVADRLLSRGAVEISRFLEANEEGQDLPLNHDLARAIRQAQIAAVMTLAADHERRVAADYAEADRTAQRMRHAAGQLRARLRLWGQAERRCIEKRVEPTLGSIEAIAMNLRDVVHPLALGHRDFVQTLANWSRSGADVADELEAWLGAPLAPALREAFQNPSASRTSWACAVRAHLMERVKTDDVVYRTVQLELTVSA